MNNPAPSLAVQFLQAAAMPERPKKIKWTYCDRCWTQSDFVLVEKTEITEIYECPDCGLRKQYPRKG